MRGRQLLIATVALAVFALGLNGCMGGGDSTNTKPDNYKPKFKKGDPPPTAGGKKGMPQAQAAQKIDSSGATKDVQEKVDTSGRSK